MVDPIDIEDIVSLRCGVRSLAVPRDLKNPFDKHGSTLGLSRKTEVTIDKDRPWITVHGGKLTGCVNVARKVAKMVATRIPREKRAPTLSRPSAPGLRMQEYPGLEEPVLAADYCAERELCWTLDDYLRRRTNISQWVQRMGLGRKGENRSFLCKLAQAFSNGNGSSSRDSLDAYQSQVRVQFDEVLGRC